jgi:hypothetical protein
MVKGNCTEYDSDKKAEYAREEDLAQTLPSF